MGTKRSCRFCRHCFCFRYKHSWYVVKLSKAPHFWTLWLAFCWFLFTLSINNLLRDAYMNIVVNNWVLGVDDKLIENSVLYMHYEYLWNSFSFSSHLCLCLSTLFGPWGRFVSVVKSDLIFGFSCFVWLEPNNLVFKEDVHVLF